MTDRSQPSAGLYKDADLYASSSKLRQQGDAKWVLDRLPDRLFRTCLDVGCGTGAFLAALIEEGRLSERAVGIDQSAEMVDAARQRLLPNIGNVALELDQADVLDLPQLNGSFDLVSMLAVLHWLYPHEARVFGWIAEQLNPEGVFCMTTYHPTVEGESVGGSDFVVLEAMARIGRPAMFPPAFAPIGTRARPASGLEGMLGDAFEVAQVHERKAVTRADDPRQYAQYHRATFGDYYLQLLPAHLHDRYLDAIGVVAMERMRALGHVTSMDMRLWVCRRPRHLHL
jgi:SAM-dependent methyltransferase